MLNIKQQLDPLEAYQLAQQSSVALPEDLSRQAAREALLRTAAALFAYGQSSKAYKLYQQLGKIIPTLGDEAARDFEPARMCLGFTAMQYLSRAELIIFFKERNLMSLFEDYDLIDVPGRLKAALALITLEERDAWRKAIWEALRENQYPFAGGKSLGEWLKQYDSAVGYDVVETYKRAAFESQAAIRAHLPEREKQLLHRLFDFYEYIKLSSESPAGYEEDVVVFEDGDATLYTTEPIASASGTAYVAPRREQESNQQPEVQYDYGRIVVARNLLLSSLGGSQQKVVDVLAQSLNSASADRALASLLLLAQLRQLDNLLEDPRFAKLVIDDLKKAGRDDNLSGIRANPTAPLYLARLLKVILEDRLGLSREDAISFGSRLSKILIMEGDKYQSIIKDNKWNL